jgi:hypothetical protein
MDDIPVTRLRFSAKVRREPFGAPWRAREERAEDAWTPKQLQDMLDEVATTPPTLRERLENWGSD